MDIAGQSDPALGCPCRAFHAMLSMPCIAPIDQVCKWITWNRFVMPVVNPTGVPSNKP